MPQASDIAVIGHPGDPHYREDEEYTRGHYGAGRNETSHDQRGDVPDVELLMCNHEKYPRIKWRSSPQTMEPDFSGYPSDRPSAIRRVPPFRLKYGLDNHDFFHLPK